MMVQIKFIWFLSLLFLVSCNNPGRDADFQVEDVSKEQEFIDSTSSGSNGIKYHQGLRYSVEGELDSAAVIEFYSYPDRRRTGTVELVKGENTLVREYGKIDLKNVLMDYYEGDTLLIRYISKGATKGYLKISTNIL
jgi:hypothetical protein